MVYSPNSFITPQQPFCWIGQSSVACDPANPVVSGGGQTVFTLTPPQTLGAPGILWNNPNGMRITKVTALPIASAPLANALYLFATSPDGASAHLIDAALLGIWNPLAMTTQPSSVDFGYSDSNPLLMYGSHHLWFGLGQAQAVMLYVEGAYF